MATAPPPARAIQDAVRERYGSLAASSCGSLSCGRALELAAPMEGEVLVDLGCGRGQEVLRAAERVGPCGRAIGIDRVDEMLAEARSRVPATVGNVELIRSDLAVLDLPDAIADVVISNCTINHAPDKEAVYREIHRVLRPGGRLVVSDVIAERELPASVRSDPAAWAACYGGAIPEADYIAAMERAGFAAIEILSRSTPYEKGGILVLSLTVRAQRPSAGQGALPRR